MRILIGRNNKIDAGGFSQHLSKLGYAVSMASPTCLIEVAANFKPNILILEYNFHLGGLRAIIDDLNRLTQTSTISVAVLTGNINKEDIVGMISLGVRGIIHYDDELRDLGDLIKIISCCYLYFSPTIKSAIPLNILPNVLTASEKEVVTRILNGQTTKEIAVALSRSVETIQNHRSAIKSKLGISGGKLSFFNYFFMTALSNTNKNGSFVK